MAHTTDYVPNIQYPPYILYWMAGYIVSLTCKDNPPPPFLILATKIPCPWPLERLGDYPLYFYSSP